jgi:hypothetical protein
MKLIAKYLFIALLFTGLDVLGQNNEGKHQTIKIAKDKEGIYTLTDAPIKVGKRILHDKDTVSISVLLNAGGIWVGDSSTGDVFVTSFESSIPFNGGDAIWLSASGKFPEGIMRMLTQTPNRSQMYIGKVCYKALQSSNYMIRKPIYIILVKPVPAPPPPDTTKAWEAKFSTNIGGLSTGKADKKELISAKKIIIEGPLDSIVVTSFDMTLDYNRPNMYMSKKLNSSDFASSNSAELTKEMLTLLKKAPANTSVSISNITFQSGGKKYETRKNISLVLE